MSLEVDEEEAPTEIYLSAEVDWEMLDKSRLFIIGVALSSAVSVALYPAMMLKTRLQVSLQPLSCCRTAANIICAEGPRGFYCGFATSLAGTIPTRALYMAALEVTKSAVGTEAFRLGFPEPAAAAAASAVAVVSPRSFGPIDVVSQRLMVQESTLGSADRYHGNIAAFKKIVKTNGMRGLY